ncbi:1-deoxy-D-xylulose-5-phosphate synthase [Geodia barretti]|uniref:1-deoxy-D-xylulose-5-phosphate synthase n=1 Tax=Geodia barretti TaxID=519541 RepID=A0AA35XCQ2_GEOBA|nr:1-deoxy-D-xylulose-5-phosphate synthase [Geodia barretti]
MTTRLLDGIDAPGDLKPLSHEELSQVAQEARDTIISVITERGGHLASNLGVVELTLALHRVFDSPKDRIVWDTTNQLYTHKLVTGRRDEFKDIRLEGGLSGFGEPSESPHDTLCAGHAGTGLSIALGIAQAATSQKSDSWTIGIVGDGAMTSGSSFEALNNIVHLNPEKMVVVLNDNGMSISENIGFLTNWRKRLITHPQYQAMIRRMTDLSKRVPTGELIYQLVKSLNDGVESFILPTMFWNEMGFRYLGPVDGHDFRQLEDTLNQAKITTDLVPVVHVVTHKGHGYEPAEDDPHQNLPVTLIADRAGIVGEDGKTHHGAFDISYLRCLPNAVVAAPMNENDLQHLIYTAYKHQGPFAIRIARGTATGALLDSDLKELPIGKGYVVREEAGLDDVSVHRIGMPDSFVEHGTADAQRRQLFLDAEGIVQQVLSAFFPDGRPSSHSSDSDSEAAAAD